MPKFSALRDGAPTWAETLVVRDIPVAAVPEPSTWALMLAGLAGVAAASRRRKS